MASVAASANSLVLVLGLPRPRSLAVFVADGDGGASATVTKTIHVVRVNDAPVLGGIGGSVGYTNAAPPILLDSNATVTDADSANFNGGKLTVLATPAHMAATELSWAARCSLSTRTIK